MVAALEVSGPLSEGYAEVPSTGRSWKCRLLLIAVFIGVLCAVIFGVWKWTKNPVEQARLDLVSCMDKAAVVMREKTKPLEQAHLVDVEENVSCMEKTAVELKEKASVLEGKAKQQGMQAPTQDEMKEGNVEQLGKDRRNAIIVWSCAVLAKAQAQVMLKLAEQMKQAAQEAAQQAEFQASLLRVQKEAQVAVRKENLGSETLTMDNLIQHLD